MKKIVITLVFLVALIGGGAYYWAFHSGSRDLQSEEAAFTLSSESLKTEFAANPDASTKKYQEKAVSIKGKIVSNQGSDISFDGVSFKMTKPEPSLKVGEEVSLKGRVVGYDDLFGEVKVDQTSIVK
jgi:hypothetical protein